MDDEKIISLMFDRDKTALFAISEKYLGYCTKIALNILGDPLDAEECFNDTLLALWNSIPPQKPRNLAAFTAKITRNIAINKYKSRNAQKRASDNIALVFDELSEIISSDNDTESELEGMRLLSEISSFVVALNKRHRTLFVRRYFYCDSISDIANNLGISENNAAVLLARIRKRLKEHLIKRGFLI